MVTEAGLGLVRVHASHNLPVDRSGAHPAAPFSRLEIGEDLGLVREGNKKKKKIVNFFRKGGGATPKFTIWRF